jgi:quercetin dioxygenase-like cupin family protein
MLKYQALVALLLIATLVVPIFAQTQSSPASTAQAPQIVAPLTAKKDGQISGDPDKPGAPFVIRIQSDPNAIVPPHWHPEDENIVVIKGTCFFGMGDKFDRSALREFSVGDYTLMPKKMPHFGWAETECIIQVHGIGPFQIIPASIEEHLSGWQNTPNGWVRDPNAGSFFKFKIADRVRSDRGEGMVVQGMHSEQSNFTQYRVQEGSGDAFFELEQNLTPVSQTSGLDFGPLSGSWEGVLHGFQGDSACAFYFHQNQQELTGVFSLQWGGAVITRATVRNDSLEVHLDTPLGKFLFSGKLNQETLSGDWSTDTGLKGAWEMKRARAVASSR